MFAHLPQSTGPGPCRNHTLRHRLPVWDPSILELLAAQRGAVPTVLVHRERVLAPPAGPFARGAGRSRPCVRSSSGRWAAPSLASRRAPPVPSSSPARAAWTSWARIPLGLPASHSSCARRSAFSSAVDLSFTSVSRPAQAVRRATPGHLVGNARRADPARPGLLGRESTGGRVGALAASPVRSGCGLLVCVEAQQRLVKWKRAGG